MSVPEAHAECMRIIGSSEPEKVCTDEVFYCKRNQWGVVADAEAREGFWIDEATAHKLADWVETFVLGTERLGPMTIDLSGVKSLDDLAAITKVVR